MDLEAVSRVVRETLLPSSTAPAPVPLSGDRQQDNDMLFGLSSLLSHLEAHDPGNAADTLCSVIFDPKNDGSSGLCGPSAQLLTQLKCLDDFLVGTAVETNVAKNKIEKLAQEILAVKHDVINKPSDFEGQATGKGRHDMDSHLTNLSHAVISPIPGAQGGSETRKNYRTNSVSSKSSGMTSQSGVDKRTSEGIFSLPGQAAVTRAPTAFTSITATSPVNAPMKKRSEVPMFLRNLDYRIGKICAKYVVEELCVLVIYIVSAFNGKKGLLPISQRENLIEVSRSPAFTYKLQRYNHVVSMVNEMPSLNRAMLDALATFFTRNSTNLESNCSSLAPLMFFKTSVNEIQQKKLEMSKQLFFLLCSGGNYIFPTFPMHTSIGYDLSVRERRRMVSGIDIQIYSDGRIYDRKKQLEQFYIALKEDRFIPIISSLFNFYDFRHIVLGIYQKYDVIVDEWRDEIERLDFTAQENNKMYGAAESDYSKAIIRPRKKTEDSTDRYYMPLQNESGQLILATKRIVNAEVDFNHTLKTFERVYIAHLASKKPKELKAMKLNQVDYEMMFGHDFMRILEFSTKFCVRLEVLNLINEPFNTVPQGRQELQDIKGLKRTATGTEEQLLKGQLARVHYLLDTYIEFAEAFYNELSPYASKWDMIYSRLSEIDSSATLQRRIGSKNESSMNQSSANPARQSIARVQYVPNKGTKTGKLASGDRSAVNLAIPPPVRSIGSRGQGSRNVGSKSRVMGSRAIGSNKSPSAIMMAPGSPAATTFDGRLKLNMNLQFEGKGSFSVNDEIKARGSSRAAPVSNYGLNRIVGSAIFRSPNKTFIQVFNELRVGDSAIANYNLADMMMAPRQRIIELKDAFTLISINAGNKREIADKAVFLKDFFHDIARSFEYESMFRFKVSSELVAENEDETRWDNFAITRIKPVSL